MKKSLLIVVPVLLLTVTSCDFVRKLVGKPTSAEIEAKKQELVKQEQARKAALEAREKAVRDSLDLVETMKEDARLRSMGIESITDGAKLDKRFYVIVGSFKNPVFADEMVSMVTKAGYESVKMTMANGFDMVSAYATDDFWEARKALYDVQNEDFCPMDVWIMMVNE